MFCRSAVLRATVRNSVNFLIRSLTPQPRWAGSSLRYGNCGERTRCAVQERGHRCSMPSLQKYYNVVDGTFFYDAINFLSKKLTYCLPNKIACALRQFLVDDSKLPMFFKFFSSISICCFYLNKVSNPSSSFAWMGAV